jgi:hypothetical protein
VDAIGLILHDVTKLNGEKNTKETDLFMESTSALEVGSLPQGKI